MGEGAKSVEWEILNLQSELCGCSKSTPIQNQMVRIAIAEESEWLNGINQ